WKRRRHDRAPRFSSRGELPRRSFTSGARRPFLRRDHKRLGRDAALRRANSGAGSLGHRRLRPRAAGGATEISANTGRSERWTNADAATKRGSRRTSVMSTSFNPPPTASFQNRAWLAGGVLLLGLLVVLFVNPTQFFRAYLVGWTFWTGIAVGSLALLMLQHLTGGGWGLVIRRVLEAATRTLPFMAVLFIPIILGSHWLYEWTN